MASNNEQTSGEGLMSDCTTFWNNDIADSTTSKLPGDVLGDFNSIRKRYDTD